MYSWTSLVITFTVPILTMRMFAEERKSGTEQLILTAPISIDKLTDYINKKFDKLVIKR